ncbi:hypothetical protein D3C87_583730 [compost metagenome]
MDIRNLNTPIKQFRISELEEIWLTICFEINRYSGNVDFEFRRDFLDKLNYPNVSPFERIRTNGVTSAIVTDALYSSNIGFYRRLHDTIIDTIFYLDNRMHEVCIKELEDVYGVGPMHARMFHHRVRLSDDPIVAQTAILDKSTRGWMREQGFFVPSKMTRNEYRQYEQTYLILSGKL